MELYNSQGGQEEGGEYVLLYLESPSVTVDK